MFEVKVILFSQSLIGSTLHHKLLDYVKIITGRSLLILPRQFFSDQVLLRDLVREPSLLQLMKNKYVACASLNALSSYIYKAYNLHLDHSEIAVKYHFSQKFLQMDAATCR